MESRAPSGYYGDWTDVTKPGTAGSVLGKRAYAFEITKSLDAQTIWLGNADYNADISTTNNGGTLIDTGEGVVTITFGSRNADKTYATDPTGIANNEDSYTMHANANKMQNDRVLGNILLTKVDLDAARYLMAGSNGDTTLEGAVYDLYAADTIEHPDGVSGVVDYSKITDANGTPIWHTTVLTNGGWDTDYLPILQKDRLVASAKITDGKLAFANLYMGRYYLVERATGLVLPIDGNGKLYVTGKYPLLNKKLERTGKYSDLARKNNEYTDYIYKNQYSAVAESRKLNGSKAWDGYYLSYAKGYLCDEVNHYKTLSYADESTYHIHAEQESQDEVLKSGFSLQKLVSTTGQPSPALKLEGAGFTVYRISKLSKAAQFKQNPDGSYDAASILSAYRKDNYDNATLKYDFTSEGQAIANMFEGNTDTVNAYNATLTADGDYANGRGNGWMPTDQPAAYRLGEMFTNDEGVFRVEGLPYGQYLIVETTIPKDVFQCDPFIVTVDANSPQSRFTVPAGSVTTPSNNYMTFNVLDEELEGYLQLIKTDTETGKAVKIANTSFALYKLDDKGNMTRISMIDPASGSATKKTDVFYTDAEGLMKTPEKLPLGRYLIEELQGPEGYFNDSAYSVEFEIKSDRVWQVVGNATNDMDEYIVTEKYCNHETLGQLTIRKLGNVLTDYQDGQFIYTQDNLAGAVYEIHAAADIATPDRQGTYWYKSGDLVATITTGAEGQVDEVTFSPTRTQATYDFLTVSHDGTKGEVTVTLPLGKYTITEVQAPYGFVLTQQSYTVEFGWDNQKNDIVLAKTIVSHEQDGDKECSYSIVNVKDASDAHKTGQTLVFENARVLPTPEKPGDKVSKIGVGIYKQDREALTYLPGAVYELYTVDDIYSADATKLLDAGAKLAESSPTNESGFTWFDVDVPIRGEYYIDPAGPRSTSRENSGRYRIVEITAPAGYLLDSTPMEVTFTYEGQQIAWQIVDATNTNLRTSVDISKQDITNGKELPGAKLEIRDADGNLVEGWTSTKTPHTVRGLELEKAYTLTETRAPDSYAEAENIVFKLVQEGNEQSNIVYAVLKPNAKQYKKLSCPQIAAQCSIQTKSVERVFRGERTTLKTAQEIAAALKCKPEKLFHIELDHRPIARKTIKEYAIFLRLVMQYAEREYGIDNDTQTLAVKGTRSRPVDCLHPEEVEALFKVLPRCSTLEQVIVMGLLNTGMRRGELAGLTWEDIDFDHCTVHVDKSLLIVNKGYHLTTTKEDNVRDIDVAPEFMEYLKTYRDQWLAQKQRMGSAWQTCMDGKWESYRESLQKLRGKNFIVINDFGWPISPDHYGKIVDRVAEKAGIRKIHPHMFRHTFVSILLSNPDIGVATVAAEAGHAQPSTTLAIYTQVYHKRQDSIRSQMSETLYKRKTPER